MRMQIKLDSSTIGKVNLRCNKCHNKGECLCTHCPRVVMKPNKDTEECVVIDSIKDHIPGLNDLQLMCSHGICK